MSKRDHFLNMVVGGLVGSIPALVIPCIIFVVEPEFASFLFLAQTFGLTFPPNAIAAFRIGKHLRRLDGTRTSHDFLNQGGGMSVSATFVFFAAVFVLKILYLTCNETPHPVETLAGFLCGAIWPAIALMFFNAIGGVLITCCFQWREDRHLEILRG